MYRVPPVFLVMLCIISCTTRTSSFSNTGTDGYAPVYAVPASVSLISFDPAKATAVPGKIYAAGNYVFQNDLNKGIHIINNTDRANPVKIGFLQVPFSTEIAVKGNYLYTNNLADLVVFDISDVTKPVLVNRIANVFPVADQHYPPFSSVVFECPDPSRGIVVRWERKQLTEARCRR